MGHITPEAQNGGLIAFLQNGYHITIDAERNLLDVAIDEAKVARRRASWSAPPPREKSGILFKYYRPVSSASQGCVTDE